MINNDFKDEGTRNWEVKGKVKGMLLHFITSSQRDQKSFQLPNRLRSDL